MTPIAQHIIIKPHSIASKSIMGLKLVGGNEYITSGTVICVSVDIKNPPVTKLDNILYLAHQEKWVAGSCMLHIDHLKAIL